MKAIPIRAVHPTCDPQFLVQTTDDGSLTLVDQYDNVAFHSACGAATETRHVYLQNTHVAKRLAAGNPTRILEIGLGTGLGMLMSLDLAHQYQTPMDYVAIEKNWLSGDLIEELHFEKLLVHPPLAQQYVQWRREFPFPAQLGTIHRWSPQSIHQVTVLVNDVHQATESLLEPRQRFDAIYFDPFDPEKNSDAWAPPVIERMAALLTDDGVLATYCVKRKIREIFIQNGFQVTRVPGPPGGKREVMVATRLGKAV